MQKIAKLMQSWHQHSTRTRIFHGRSQHEKYIPHGRGHVYVISQDDRRRHDDQCLVIWNAHFKPRPRINSQTLDQMITIHQTVGRTTPERRLEALHLLRIRGAREAVDQSLKTIIHVPDRARGIWRQYQDVELRSSPELFMSRSNEFLTLKDRFDFSGRLPESPLNLSLDLRMESSPQRSFNLAYAALSCRQIPSICQR